MPASFDPSALRSLHDLLSSSFSTWEFAVLLKYHDDGWRVLKNLPDASVAANFYWASVVDELIKHGCITPMFFSNFAKERPNRKGEIRAAMVALLGTAEGIDCDSSDHAPRWVIEFKNSADQIDARLLEAIERVLQNTIAETPDLPEGLTLHVRRLGVGSSRIEVQAHALSKDDLKVVERLVTSVERAGGWVALGLRLIGVALPVQRPLKHPITGTWHLKNIVRRSPGTFILASTIGGGLIGWTLQPRLEPSENCIEVEECRDRCDELSASQSSKFGALKFTLEARAGGLVGDFPAATFLLDISGSMGGDDGASTKLDSARVALLNLLNKIPDGQRVAVRVFGSDDCAKSRLLTGPGEESLSASARATVERNLGQLRPEGSTNIAQAIVDAVDAIRVTPQRSGRIVLVTDGEETCGGDPVARIREAKSNGIDFQVHVVGLGVEGNPNVVRQLRSIAMEGGGIFVYANDQSQLEEALLQLYGSIEVQLSQDGRLVLSQQLSSSLMEVPEGATDVLILGPSWTASLSGVPIRRGKIEEIHVVLDERGAILQRPRE